MLSRWPRLLFLSPLLLACIVFYSAHIKLEPLYIYVLAISAAFAGFLVSLLSSFYSFRLLGIGVCVLPLLGSGVLNAFVACFLLGSETRRLIGGLDYGSRTFRQQKLSLYAFLFIFLGLCISGFHSALLQVDFLVFGTIYNSGGFLGFLRFMLLNSHPWRGMVPVFGNVFLAFLLLIVLLEQQEPRRVLGESLQGLAYGAICITICALLQFFEIGQIFSLNRSAFWIFQQRYSASLSDPNAFGVFAAFLIPLLLFAGSCRVRSINCFAALLLFSVAPLSGSRSFWLGLVLISLLLCNRLELPHGRVPSRHLGTLLGIIALILFAAIGYPPLNETVRDYFPVSGVERLLDTAHWNKIDDMFSSRKIFASVAISMWKESPWTGVGLERFYLLQDRTAKSIGIDLKGWVDNANNFYLHILAEQGLIGLFLVGMAFLIFYSLISGLPIPEIESDENSLLAKNHILSVLTKVLAISFSILLLTGPHLFFDEIRYLAVLVLALGSSSVQAVRERQIRFYGFVLFLSALCCPVLSVLFLGNLNLNSLMRGVYTKESTASDGEFVWTAKRARFVFCRDEKSPIVVVLKAGNPDIEKKPLTINIYKVSVGMKRELIQSLELGNNEWRQVILDRKKFVFTSPQIIEIEVGRVWTPAPPSFFRRGDVRWLGVMLRWPESLCDGAVSHG